MSDLFDTHAHLTDPGLAADREGVLARAEAAGVRRILAVGSDLASSRESLGLAEKHERIEASAGVHPELAGTLGETWEGELDRLLAERRPAAVGECGLDGHHPDPPLERQVPVFRAQVRLANKHGLPLVMHSRKAGWDVLRILKEEGAGEAGGVFHCIDGDEILARAALDAGFHLGVGGIATFPRNDVLRRLLPRLPRERLLLETDSPYLAPQKVRGKRNEPAYLAHTAEVVAAALGVSVDELAASTTANAMRLFRLPGGR